MLHEQLGSTGKFHYKPYKNDVLASYVSPMNQLLENIVHSNCTCVIQICIGEQQPDHEMLYISNTFFF